MDCECRGEAGREWIRNDGDGVAWTVAAMEERRIASTYSKTGPGLSRCVIWNNISLVGSGARLTPDANTQSLLFKNVSFFVMYRNLCRVFGMCCERTLRLPPNLYPPRKSLLLEHTRLAYLHPQVGIHFNYKISLHDSQQQPCFSLRLTTISSPFIFYNIKLNP